MLVEKTIGAVYYTAKLFVIKARGTNQHAIATIQYHIGPGILVVNAATI